MMIFRVVVIAAIVLAAGCATPATPPTQRDAGTQRAIAMRCIHPWPCGDEWPADLKGPFELGATSRIRAPTTAGVLDGALFVPALPAGVRAPLVLEATPYPGQCPRPSTGCDFAQDSPVRGTPIERDTLLKDEGLEFLVEAGFAVAIVNMPGTGDSEGCFDNYGPPTQKALAELVTWLAAQPWSNGRVGMYGLSAAGTTPFAAAVENPTALKTIVPAGIETNPYLFEATPQGAMRAEVVEPLTYSTGITSAPTGGDVTSLPGVLGGSNSRYCADLVAYATSHQSGATGDRSGAFWTPRELIMRFPNVTTSVFIAHGLLDAVGSGHARQEDDAWNALSKAPKRMLLGNWAHAFPPTSKLIEYPRGSNWSSIVVPWLDFWLKGVGPAPPREGIVDHQDTSDSWRASDAWPPKEAREEGVPLAGGSFLSRSGPTDTCAALTTGASPGAIATRTPAGASPLVVAGNPWVLLHLTSDAPAATVHAALYDVSPDLGCDAKGSIVGARLLSEGAADLRHHAGNFVAKDFPVGTSTAVRIDLWNIAHTLPSGHAFALVLRGAGDEAVQDARPAQLVSTNGTLIVPLLEGTLGGGPPPTDAPPKPFVPR